MKRVDIYTEAIKAYRRANNAFQQAKVAHLRAIEEQGVAVGGGHDERVDQAVQDTCVALRAACQSRWRQYKELEGERVRRILLSKRGEKS